MYPQNSENSNSSNTPGFCSSVFLCIRNTSQAQATVKPKWETEKKEVFFESHRYKGPKGKVILKPQQPKCFPLVFTVYLLFLSYIPFSCFLMTFAPATGEKEKVNAHVFTMGYNSPILQIIAFCLVCAHYLAYWFSLLISYYFTGSFPPIMGENIELTICFLV